jgi:hypothetical protein
LITEDDSVQPRKRGEGKSGGALAPVLTLGADGRPRKPIKSSTSSSMDFNRFRNITTLNDRITEINKLREELQGLKTSSSSDKKLEVLRSNLSSHMIGVSKSTSSFQPPPVYTVGTTIKIDSNLAPDVFFANIEGKGVSRELESEAPMHGALFDTTAKVASSQKLAARPSGSRKIIGKNDTYRQFSDDASNIDLEKSLLIEESKAKRQLHYMNKDEEIIYGLKLQERQYRCSEESRGIERKRRILNEEEGRRTGPPSEDTPNVYDFYAIRVQSTIRGWLVRCWVRWYRQVSRRACMLIQSMIRGWLGRTRVRRIRRQYHAVVLIQKSFRGWNTRVSC